MGQSGLEELPEEINDLTSRIISAAMEVHSELGPGLYERVYRKAMGCELPRMGMRARFEKPLVVFYKGELIDEEGYRLDCLVDDTVILELKSVEAILPRHKKQLTTYLRLEGKPVGLLINFNVAHLRDGIVRIINPWRSRSGHGRGKAE